MCWRRPPLLRSRRRPCNVGRRQSKTVNFAIELPQQGSEKAASDPIINGIKLAVKEAGGAGRWLHDRDPELGHQGRRAQRRPRPADRRGQHGPARGDPRGRRRHRPAQLERCRRRRSRSPARPAWRSARPANTNPDLTKGEAAADASRRQAEQLHPRRHHGRRPGSGRGAVHLTTTSGQEVGLHHRRHRDLREGRRRHLRGRVQGTRRHRRQARRRAEDHAGLRLAHDRRRGPEPRGDLLRRRHRLRRRADPQGGRSGRPRGHPVRRSRRHQRRRRRHARTRS